MSATANIPQRVHIVGAGGGHMSAIAKILHTWGHTVTGSDMAPGEKTERLEKLGIVIRAGHAAENIGDAEMVVTTSGARTDNPEIVAALERGIPVLKRHEMVARLMEGRFAICVSGTHGKTTTSGLIAHMLVQAGLDPTYLIGDEVRTLGTNAAPGSGKHVVVEADEFDRAFLSYTPDIAIVLNVEADHLNIYGSEREVAAAFGEFMERAPADGIVITNADSALLEETVASARIAARRETYSTDGAAAWRAGASTQSDQGQTFEVTRDGESLGEFFITMPGRHNVGNALAAIAACTVIGMTTDVIRETMRTFIGAHRRFEYVGEAGGVTVIDDYAHHPTEVRMLVRSARERFDGRRIVFVFQPHTFSRTKYMFNEFKTCFEGVDRLYIAVTDGSRERAEEGTTSEELIRVVTSPAPVYLPVVDAAAADVLASDLGAGDVMFTVGAGYIHRAGPMVLERLRSRAA